MPGIHSGYNEICDVFLHEYEGIKLSDIPIDARITIFANVQFDTTVDLVSNLCKYDESTWCAIIRLLACKETDEVLEYILNDRKKYIGDIIEYNKLYEGYHVQIHIKTDMSIMQAVDNCKAVQSQIMNDYFCRKSNKLNASVLEEIRNKLPVHRRALNKIKMEIENFQDESDINHDKMISITGRVKDIHSIQEKVYRKNISWYEIFDRFDDIAGVRVVCEYLNDVYDLLEYLKSHPMFKVVSPIDDKIANPSPEGYRGIHLTVSTDVYYKGHLYDNILVEIQIRTSYQNTWAMKTHKLTYKRDEIIPQSIKKQMKLLGDLLHNADETSQILKEQIEKEIKI